ncbi:GreA/GreB family elongation factor, partial [Salmonella enterica subsp. enterica serovar Kentucky]|nr:GreA/GreB family elongation factor [Salmonella enterica subsp. enterica serovar Kentucky]
QQEGKVFFGAWVEIENDDGDTLKFRIVGYDEIFGRKDYISIDGSAGIVVNVSGSVPEAVIRSGWIRITGCGLSNGAIAIPIWL